MIMREFAEQNDGSTLFRLALTCKAYADMAIPILYG